MASYEQTMIKLEKMAQATNAAQMNWQEKMSKTSHQMEVADLKASGLNPVLSANSGAQSYSTSLDSAASAVGNLASAHESASAQRFAAKQAAAATRAAAAANLAAAREAAAASRYAADKHFESAKYSVDYSKSGSPFGIIDNYRKQTKSDNTGIGKTMSQLWKDVEKKPDKFFKVNGIGKFTDLNASGRNIVQKSLRNLGISESLPHQIIMFEAIFHNDTNAQKIVQRWMTSFNNKANNARTVWSKRSGSGVW